MLNEVERQIIDNINIGISIFSYKNQKLKLIGINKKIKNLFGILNDQTNKYNDTIHSFLHREDQIIIENSLKKLKNYDQTLKFSTRFYNFNENIYKYFEIEISVNLIEDNSLKLYVTCKDNFASNFSNSEETNSSLLKKLGIASWKYDINEKKVYDYHNFMGYKQNILNERNEIENVPQSIIDNKIIYPEDINTYNKLYNDLYQGKLDTFCDVRIYFENIKEYKWVRIIYTSYKNTFNNSIELIGTMKDINEQLIDKNNYKDLTAFWESYCNFLIISSLIDLSDNKILGIKGNHKDFFNISDIDLFFENISKNINDKEHDLKAINLFNKKNLLEKYTMGERKIEEEWKIKINNEILWTKTTLKLLKNPYNNHIIANLNIENISNQKKMDKIIHFVVQNEFDYLVRADYNKNEYLVYFSNSNKSDSFKKKAILTLEEFKELIAPDVINQKNSYNSEKINFKTIFRNLKKTGSFKKYYKTYDEYENLKIKEIKISNINLEKGIFYIIRRDITDVYNKNEQKNKALKEALTLAENANKTKTTFLSTMSHDIKTPMNAIIGMTDLTYNLIKKDDLQLKENLDIIKDSSKTLMNIINEVLDMNRINSGQFEFVSKEFNLENLTYSILKSFEPIIKHKNLKIYKHLNIIHNLLVGDSSNIEKVAHNLIDNAIKYTPNNGQIDIYINEIDKKSKNGFAFFQVKIKDNGIGISKEDQIKIFNPFYRGVNAQNKKGSGLGLSIVKGILELRGSNIKIISAISKGTSFIIEISFKITDIYNQNPKEINIADSYSNSNDKIDFKKRKILLVEDNEINRLIARKNLEKYNLIVEEAINGEKGYHKFINSPCNYYSLIIMDLRMPLLNGIDCTKRIRKSNHLNSKKIPIIALTANTFIQDRNLCFEAGMNDYLSKPINILHLKNILAKYIIS